MSLSKFSKGPGPAPAQGGGGRFSGGGQAPTPQQQRAPAGRPAPAPAQGGGRFGGGRAAAPPPEDEGQPDGYGDEPEQQAPQRFGRNNAAPARGGRQQGQGRDRAPHVPGRGRFTGLRSKKAKPPWLEEGKHLVEVVNTFESFKPGTGPRTHIQVKIITSTNASHEPGDMRSIKYNTDERAWGATAESIFMFARAAAGFASDEEALDAVGEDFMQDLIDAMNGNAEAQQTIGPNGQPIGANPLEGCFLEIISSRGNMADNGIQFYEHDWFPAQAPF